MMRRVAACGARACAPVASARRCVTMTVKGPAGEWTVDAPPGKRLHIALKDDGVEMECSCGGQQACSTCHVIVSDKLFKELPEAEDEELDMLDIAADVRETSRLACALKVQPYMEGETFTLPDEVKDFW